MPGSGTTAPIQVFLVKLIFSLILVDMNEQPATAPVRRYFPVALSALVYPGVGQLAQGRWVAGAFYLVSFTALFIWFAVNAYQTLVMYYSFMSPDSLVEPTPVPMTRILIPFSLDFLIYLVNLLDVFVACHRRAARSATLTMPDMPDMSDTLPTPVAPTAPAAPVPPPAPPRTPPKL